MITFYHHITIVTSLSLHRNMIVSVQLFSFTLECERDIQKWFLNYTDIFLFSYFFVGKYEYGFVKI